MKKRKIFLGLALAVATVFTLGSCGDKEEETPAASSQAAQSSQVVASSEAAQSSQVVASSEAAQSSEVAASSEVAQSSEVAASSEAAQSSEVAASSEAAQSSQAAASSAAEAGDEEKSIKLNGVAYDSIAKALAKIPTSGDTNTYTITLGKGTYTENGLHYKGSATVHIKGDTETKYGADVIIKGRGNDLSTEKGRSLLEIEGTGNLILENITLQSDWVRAVDGENQVEVLGVDTTGFAASYNCSFKSTQDTIRTVSKTWFYGCYIEGDTDFIWMEASGIVALYEKCEIVSIYDEALSSHTSYVAAPKMTVATSVGKGLVIYNSTVKESDEAKEKGQKTYLARTPWSSGCYNQAAYINTTCSDIETDVWYKSQIATEYPKTAIGWKMDQATATSLNYSGNNDIIDNDTVSKEFNGRKAILNRQFNCNKQKYECDSNIWDIDALITKTGWTVDTDNSLNVLDGETVAEKTEYNFDGSDNETVDGLCNGFAQEIASTGAKPHYQGAAGATITIPVSGKCYVSVIGYYAGTAEAKANTQGESVMFFNNGSTNTTITNTYVVYDENATEVVITAKAKTYITKIIVEVDETIENTPVQSLEISKSSNIESVGVPLTLSATINPKEATNKSIKWSSSDPTVGVIDEYTGKVTFKSAGTVTFTATACDGIEKTATITCNPIAPTWTKAEWYTTDNTLAEEEGALEIGNFDTNASTYKDLGSDVEFTNLDGKPITTKKGLKLNGDGKLSISTTKSNAILTVVIKEGVHSNGTHVKVLNGTNTITAASSNTDETSGLTTFTYVLATAGTYDIVRDYTKEVNPIVYAKCEYDLTISKSTFVEYKQGSYNSVITENDVVLNHNAGDYVLDGSKMTFDNITYEGCKQNNSANNWLKFNTGNTITFTAKTACTLKVFYYGGTVNAKVTLDGTEVETTTSSEGATDTTGYEYAISAGGTVVITSTANGYLGAFEVLFA